MKTKSIYQEAINCFGNDKQIRKTLEELAELQVAIHHSQDMKKVLMDVVGEIADVEIMLEQLKIIYKIDSRLLNREKDRKLDRLEETIKRNSGYYAES